MLSDEEEEATRKDLSAARNAGKRKIVLESDSDDEVQPSNSKNKKAPGAVHFLLPSHALSPTKSILLFLARSEENELSESAKASFSSSLSKFTKSPVKSTRRLSRSRASDDDDFVVPDDESDSPPPSVKSGKSSRSSRSATLSSDADDFLDDDEDEDEAPKKSKGKKKAPAVERPKLAKEASSQGGSSSFLTAAERRLKEAKEEKKTKEDPYAFLLDPKDRDGVRPGEPGYDPRTLHIPAKAWKEFTPFEKQFWEIKQNHFDTVLFFQKGKFLELYEDDARIGHREFDLKLTNRVKMCMVGVPESSFNFWAAKFLAKGYKVGRVDQSETALGAEMRLAADKAKGGPKGKADKIVQRELNKVYTNGTLVDAELLIDEEAGHCVSIREHAPDPENPADAKKESTFGVAVLDSSTSEFNLSAFEDDVCRTKLETLLRQLRPKEIIFTKGNLSVSTNRLLKATLPEGCLWTSLRDVEGFDYDQTLKELAELYPATGNAMRDEDDPVGGDVPEAIRDMYASKPAIEALGSLIWYLRQLNIDKDILSMKNFNIYDPMKRGQGLVLDGQTLAHIEVLRNSDGTEDGSLLKLLGRCITPFGKRLFRIWLCMPLKRVEDINARLDAVQDLLDNPSFEQMFTELAKGLPDLERIVSRIHANNCTVKDFLKVLQAFKKLSNGLSSLADVAAEFDSKMITGLLRSAPDLTPNLKNVQSMFKKPAEGSGELEPMDGKDEEYDNVMSEIARLEKALEKKLKQLEDEVGTDLTYWHSALGTKDIYLVQTKASFKNIPKQWTKHGATKAAARWTVPALAGTIRALKEARENRNTAIKQFKNRLFAEFDADRGVWLRAIRVLAELDCLFSLAKSSTALGEPICRPELVEGDAAFVDFEELRHPALLASSSLKGDFIPNDVRLGGDVGRIVLLTASNSGKSTAMRMTAAGVIMAQLGMMVPARSAKLCPVDAILTRMGAYDNMFSNASTFKVELDESCKILREATPKSLVILDELGRGTSTYDGMAIAGAVLHELATHTLALSFFATHYGSLTDDFAYHPNIRNMHMATMVDDEQQELVFLYKLVDGIASSSFGTHVAKLAGVPSDVVQRAAVVSEDFARQFKEKLANNVRKKRNGSSRVPLNVQSDFAYLVKLAMGVTKLPEDPVRKRETLVVMKKAVASCLLASGASVASS
ncbi:DNA mismatch repair protein Msh6 [Punctularia strigosozonata HHB-11173 SS5]|uniref:DNA mismatch repair protein Msh6 n=1 Tax=Punctularia strigosozonata (strain HHB-11173) TaxID=741275 RepID=UPI0004417B43|nr:DNA mismatch repair protein Msh6 [Punctularia strigosozonata HHB-11173 SS5]EIN08523.1 DNA mismatch repair protein Msh6 [Punctularia strigosozonata HHB-11173 SS5]